jgi:hypothetical protein
MRALFLSLTILALFIMPTWVYADGCTQYTVQTPQGMKFCQQCCYGGSCQVSCL